MIYDLTEKLSFESNPIIKVKDYQFEVNADAETMLKMMGIFGQYDDATATQKAYELMFSEAAREKIAELKLSAKDWQTLIEVAMDLVQGNNPDDVKQADETPSVL